MGWDRYFLAAIEGHVLAPSFSVATVDGPGTSFTLAATYAELPTSGVAVADVVMDSEGPRVEGEGLQMPAFTTNHGGFTWTATTANPDRVIQDRKSVCRERV